MEKQIEEMRLAISEKQSRGFLEIPPETKGCSNEELAEHLYNAGYRKERQGEWVLLLEDAYYIEDPETGKVEFYNTYYCSNCGREVEETDVSKCEKYCSNCGAKMRGE